MDSTDLWTENDTDDEEVDLGVGEDDSLDAEVALTFVNEFEAEIARVRAERDISLQKRKKRWADLKSSSQLDRLLIGMEEIVNDAFKGFFPVSGQRTFSSKIGIGSKTIARLFVRYWDDFEAADISLVDVLIALNWCKEDITLDSLAANWKISRSACQKLVSETCGKLYVVLDEIRWNRNEDWQPEEVESPPGHPLEGVTFSINETECGIAKPVDKAEQALWLSQKTGKHTVKYEFCTHISSGRIMWVSGGIPGSIPDSELCASSGVLDFIPDGQKGLADEGIDKTKLLAKLKVKKGEKSLTGDEKIYNKVLSELKSEAERVNGRLRNFEILWLCRTRNRLHHGIVFTILCNLVNIQLEVQPLGKRVHPNLLNADFVIPDRARP